MSKDILDIALIGLLLTDVILLMTARLRAMVVLVTAQGVMLAGVALASQWSDVTWELWTVVAGGVFVKAAVFPWLMMWTARRLRVADGIEARISILVSASAGLVFVLAAFLIGARLEPPQGVVSTIAIPVSLVTVLVGLYLIVVRPKALTQVAGYLVLENGIFAFGTSLAWGEGLVVELGILLDVFVALFVMGITVFHIAQTFDSIDVGEMTELKDMRR